MVHKQLVSIFFIIYRANVIDSYGNALICQWIKAFGEPMCSENSVNLHVSLSRSGLVQSTKQVEDKDIQTDPCTSDQPNLRINCRICTDRIKATCSEISTKCEVSVEVARLAVKIVMTWLYGHDAYLNIKETTDATVSSSTI